jgi:hypothetical protein
MKFMEMTIACAPLYSQPNARATAQNLNGLARHCPGNPILSAVLEKSGHADPP